VKAPESLGLLGSARPRQRKGHGSLLGHGRRKDAAAVKVFLLVVHRVPLLFRARLDSIFRDFLALEDFLEDLRRRRVDRFRAAGVAAFAFFEAFGAAGGSYKTGFPLGGSSPNGFGILPASSFA
jgi:hypothetical protein